MIKIDFVAWTLFSAHRFHDPGVTPAQAYRKALSIVRSIAGEKCHILDCGPGKMEILKKIFPATIEQAKPVDLYDADPQTIFSCKINRDFGEWDVVAFFNPDPGKSITREIKLDRMLLDTTKTYLCFDFWNETLIGEVNQTIKATVGPASVALFSLHEKQPYPQILSTNRHVKQGAIELVDAQYDSSAQILYGTSVSPQGSGHSILSMFPKPMTGSPVTAIFTNTTDPIRSAGCRMKYSGSM
jgi:hypothetical protein